MSGTTGIEASRNSASSGAAPDGLRSTAAVHCITVSAPFSGMEMYFRTLQQVFAEGDDVDVVGSVWLTHRPSELLSRVPPLSLHWALSAWWSTTCRLRDLRRRGIDGDVVFFNHLSPVVLLGRLPRRSPVVLNLDATPSLTTTMGAHYLGRDARPRVIERVKVWLYRTVYRRVSHVVAYSTLRRTIARGRLRNRSGEGDRRPRRNRSRGVDTEDRCASRQRTSADPVRGRGVRTEGRATPPRHRRAGRASRRSSSTSSRSRPSTTLRRTS